MKTVKLIETLNTSRGKILIVTREDEIRKGDTIKTNDGVYRVMGITFPTRPSNDGRFSIVVLPIDN